MKTSQATRWVIVVGLLAIAVLVGVLNWHGGVASLPLNTPESAALINDIKALNDKITSVEVGYRYSGDEAATLDVRIEARVLNQPEADQIASALAPLISDVSFSTSYSLEYESRYGIKTDGVDVAMLTIVSLAQGPVSWSYSLQKPNFIPNPI